MRVVSVSEVVGEIADLNLVVGVLVARLECNQLTLDIGCVVINSSDVDAERFSNGECVTGVDASESAVEIEVVDGDEIL